MKSEVVICPNCGQSNSVPDNTLGLDYNCWICGHEFTITRVAICPHCQAKNRLMRRTENMQYSCFNCGGVFILDDDDYVRIPGNPASMPYYDYGPAPKKNAVDACVDMMVDPIRAYLRPFSINARSSRLEFFGVSAITIITMITAGHMAYANKSSGILLLLLLYSLLCLGTCFERRARDSGQEKLLGEMLAGGIVSIITIIGIPIMVFFSLKAFVLLLFTPSLPYRNQYGDPP